VKPGKGLRGREGRPVIAKRGKRNMRGRFSRLPKNRTGHQTKEPGRETDENGVGRPSVKKKEGTFGGKPLLPGGTAFGDYKKKQGSGSSVHFILQKGGKGRGGKNHASLSRPSGKATQENYQVFEPGRGR